MKIRTSYVSNSSSSSFIIQGKRIEFDQITPANFAIIYAKGNWRNDGADILKLSSIFRDVDELNEYKFIIDDMPLVEAIETNEADAEDGVFINPNAESIFCWKKDQHSTSSFDEFIEHYQEEITKSIKNNRRKK